MRRQCPGRLLQTEFLPLTLRSLATCLTLRRNQSVLTILSPASQRSAPTPSSITRPPVIPLAGASVISLLISPNQTRTCCWKNPRLLSQTPTHLLLSCRPHIIFQPHPSLFLLVLALPLSCRHPSCPRPPWPPPTWRMRLRSICHRTTRWVSLNSSTSTSTSNEMRSPYLPCQIIITTRKVKGHYHRRRPSRTGSTHPRPSFPHTRLAG